MEQRSDRYAWRLVKPGQPLERIEQAGRPPEADEVLIEVAGCGLCHTDLGFIDGTVKTRAQLPLVLGHEISGRVVDAGMGAEEWVGRAVLVPAVIPCGDCDLCNAGRGNVCARQKMPGNDLDGGFATHVTVPTTGLSTIENLPDQYELADLSVIADAVTTPLQAVRRAEVSHGDFVVVVGAGGVGTYAVQIAAASGAIVVAVDIDEDRLSLLRDHGAAATVNARDLSARDVRDSVREHAKSLGMPRTGWKIFECSGTATGQETAYGMLGPAATLAVVGFTMEKVTIRLSNLMAFDATAFGSWGCPPERYPEAIGLVTSGKVALGPFIRKIPMADIEQVLEEAHRRSDARRTILIP
ncbi:MAG: alcohol dehydrogenase catalytic domain-containing protein [Acidimicrobiia bacterium]|nr:MAG: alcohol dehydrogenase catalytic domain-containing protein [Acidimicrobiia bacterium]